MARKTKNYTDELKKQIVALKQNGKKFHTRDELVQAITEYMITIRINGHSVV